MEITRSLEETLFELERLAMTGSQEQLEQLLASDFKEFGSSGAIYDKQKTLEAPMPSHVAEFTIRDFELKELSPDIVLATYHLTKTFTATSQVSSLRISIWKNSGDGWRMVFHQGTLSA